MDFMLDTSAINRILDGEVENEWSLRGYNFITDIQLQEILDTRDERRRNVLFQGLLALPAFVLRPTDIPQRFDGGHNFDTGERFPLTWSVVQYAADMSLSFGRFVPVIARGLPPNRKKPHNPLRDAFIAEAALLNGLTLVTADGTLARNAKMFGVRVELIT